MKALVSDPHHFNQEVTARYSDPKKNGGGGYSLHKITSVIRGRYKVIISTSLVLIMQKMSVYDNVLIFGVF